LERVRARTMAMQKSDELMEAANLLFLQVQSLGIPIWSCGYNIWEKGEKVCTGWMSTQGVIQPSFRIPLTEHRTFIHMNESRLKAEPFYVEELKGEKLADHYRYMFSLPDFKEIATKQLQSGFPLPQSQIHHVFNFKHGNLIFLSAEAIPEAWDIFKRFTAVFEQTYTRFLDLQKAEAQAREAQIEAALEKVRSTSLAMHHSDELEKVVVALFDKLLDLGIPFHGALIYLFEKEKKNIQLWVASNVNPTIKVNLPYDTQIADNPIVEDLWTAVEEKKDVLNRCYTGKVKNEYFRYVAKYNESKIHDSVKEMMLAAESWTVSFAAENNSAIGIDSFGGLLTNHEDFQIVKRFARVFEQAYTRFLDLQKAEAQAREAQIEMALEKVRSRSLAMHKSDELQDVVNTVFERLKELNVQVYTAIIIIFKEGSKDIVWWMQNRVNQQYPKILIRYTNIPYLEDLFQAKENGKELFSKCYVGEEKYKLYNYLFRDTDLKSVAEEQKKFLFENEFAAISIAFAKNTAIHLTSYSERSFSEEDHDILKRFAKVFDQAYTRFLDLQKAEAQAREAQIETALERVRSRTLAMQRSDELAETAAVLFQQLILLGIEPNRLYLNIVKDETGDAEFWITDEDGSKIAMAYSVNMNTNPTFKKMYEGWQTRNKSLILDMQGTELSEYFKFLASLNVPFKEGLSQERRLQYIAYFSKGFIGMASPEEQPAETMQLLERFAAVFNLTFTRFNDLKIAEAHALKAEQDLIEIKAARKHAEEALVELQATQRQLVQSEKMASLGELTAGIAHEIQNPLNFVNNFSDVSSELLEEMKTELKKGNTKDVIAIVNDVKQNLEKILHHGKRADAIVKGMLQHSRTSSSQKELTDINTLADEYLRLAYHGLRAKDKSFNAKFTTDLDKSIGKINVIPQEIGRVILNLINNAFYTVSEKQKRSNGTFEPTVTVSTKRNAENVTITVADNGNGISQKNLDKIFQPFFTTKPTGQGTGLGLSLAYDIITKGHGGDIKIETKEGEGSKFIVIIPSTS
jgi:signal transduction histidine kinase